MSKIGEDDLDEVANRHSVERIIKKFVIGNSILYVAGGSVIEFAGDALVNAANNGGLGGGGIDGMFNRLGGEELQKLRLKLPIVEKPNTRIRTGSSVVTKAAGKLKGKYVIHAVGPDYNEYLAPNQNWDVPDELLSNAYKSIVQNSKQLGDVRSVGCCLLSAGIYAGARGKKNVIKIACKAVMEALAAKDVKLEFFLVGFTQEEQDLLKSSAEQEYKNLFAISNL